MPKLIKYGMKGEQKFDAKLWAVVHDQGSGKLPKCGCDSRLDHWQKGAKSKRAKCSYLGCNSNAVDGAHIKRATAEGRPIGQSYIVPMCDTHNRSRFTNPFFVKGNCVWILEKKQSYCKKGSAANQNDNFLVIVTGVSNKATCGCKDALSHFSTQSKARKCLSVSCTGKPYAACLVKSADGRRDKLNWLAPLCKTHAKKNKELWLSKRATLVSPAKNSKCGR